MQPSLDERDPVEALAEEFLARRRRGEKPTIADYVAAHPDLADSIRDLFPALLLLEDVGDSSLARAPQAPRGPAPGVAARLGDYRILREIGRGGMGVVYEAEQTALGRRVALKVLPPQALGDEQKVRRFQREARAAARLHHTNIVPVFGVGEDEGTHYFAMQFIQGLGLNAVLAELRQFRTGNGAPEPPPSAGPQQPQTVELARSLMTGDFRRGALHGGGEVPPGPDATTAGPSLVAEETPSRAGRPAEALTLSSGSAVLPGRGSETVPGRAPELTYWQSVACVGLQVADALEYAHKQGVLHRDVKPSNLLLDMRGTVWVTDFGLAKTDDQQALTQTGDILGTLRYLPPEAFEGKVDARGDVYALGLTLYEMLALRPAFEEADQPRLVKQVTTGQPARLAKLNRHVPRDLETIVHKAIDPDPARRYQTAGDLGADLQRFLDDEPIEARRVSDLERLRRWARHNKGVAALSAVVLGLLIAVALVSSWSSLRLRAEKVRADAAERKALAGHLDALLTASPDSVPFLLDQLRGRKEDVLPALLARRDASEPRSLSRLRLEVALAALGEGSLEELGARVGETPPGESRNVVLALKGCDRAGAIEELKRRDHGAATGVGRTRLSIALLELGAPDAARRELTLRDDPSDRVRFIHLFSAWHGDLAAVPELLRGAEDSAFRSGLCLAVGSVDFAPPATAPADLQDSLAELYVAAPDGATHSAAGWALRRHGLLLPPIPPTPGPAPGRQWFVNRQGMTMIGVEPGFFQPHDYEVGNGPVSTVVLTRPLFALDEKVTVEMLGRFRAAQDRPEEERPRAAAAPLISPAPPATARWNVAIQYCNWLSREEGRSPCYRPDAAGRPGLTCDFQADGYRMPTDAEWEYLFRTDTTTRFVVGEDVERLQDYGRVFAVNPGPGKAFLPNPWGLYDLLGNDWEMGWDGGYPLRPSGMAVNPLGPVGSLVTSRGGASSAGLFYLHGSMRYSAEPTNPKTFRVVCGVRQPGDNADEQAETLLALTKAVERNPAPARGYVVRGRHHAGAGRWTEALADANRALALAPNDPRALALAAEVAPHIGKGAPDRGK